MTAHELWNNSRPYSYKKKWHSDPGGLFITCYIVRVAATQLMYAYYREQSHTDKKRSYTKRRARQSAVRITFYAEHIGVEILDKDEFSPIVFNTLRMYNTYIQYIRHTFPLFLTLNESLMTQSRFRRFLDLLDRVFTRSCLKRKEPYRVKKKTTPSAIV